MTRTSIFQAIRGREVPEDTILIQSAEPVYKPSYEIKLRLIGMHFDRTSKSAVKLLEVPGGFLARAVGGPYGADELLEFPDTMFPGLFAEAAGLRARAHEDEPLRLKSDLIPTSYEDVLRAIGNMLDGALARSIVLSEGPGAIYLSGMRLENNSTRSAFAPFDQMLFPEDIDRLLDDAYRQRDFKG
jgi:hypothetical protein